MSSTKRIVNYHISRLKDKRPEIKLEAIRELELLSDTDALDALKALYTNESEDPQVRQAAQSAGRNIYLKSEEVKRQS